MQLSRVLVLSWERFVQLEKERGPFRKGDRRDNLRRLTAGPKPHVGSVLWKMYEMLRLNMGEELVMEGLELVSRCAWSTIVEEQGHRAASGLARLHQAYGTATLQCRSFLWQVGPLFCECKVANKIKLKNNNWGGLCRKNAPRLIGRQLCVRQLNQEAQRQRSMGRNKSPTIHKDIMARHGPR